MRVDTLFLMLRVKKLIKEGVMKFIKIQLESILDTSLLHRVCSAFSKFNFVKISRTDYRSKYSDSEMKQKSKLQNKSE